MDLEDAPVAFDPIPRNGRGQPMIVPKGGGKPEPYTRTTTFIDVIEDKSNLTDWGKRMTLVGAARRPMLLDEVRAIDPYGNRYPDRNDKQFRDRIDDLVELALGAAGAHEKRNKGTHLHGLSELVDAGIALPDGLPTEDRLDMAAYALATEPFTFSHVEEFVVIPHFKVGGTPDRITMFRDPDDARKTIYFPPGASPDDSFIFDLKTGTTEYGGLKMASQLGVYSRAEFYDPTVCPAPPYAKSVTKRDDPEGFEANKLWSQWTKTEFPAELASTAYRPIPPVNQKWGIILNLPSGSGEAELMWADLEIGWEAAELATVIHRTRKLTSNALRAWASIAA